MRNHNCSSRLSLIKITQHVRQNRYKKAMLKGCQKIAAPVEAFFVIHEQTIGNIDFRLARLPPGAWTPQPLYDRLFNILAAPARRASAAPNLNAGERCQLPARVGPGLMRHAKPGDRSPRRPSRPLGFRPSRYLWRCFSLRCSFRASLISILAPCV